jgi:adenosine deaminase
VSHVKHLKKADLHAHLNGCIPTNKVRELVARFGVRVPVDFDLRTDLNVGAPAGSLESYLKPWKVFKRLPVGRDCLRDMVISACEALAQDNVVYAELRNSPFNIPELNSISLNESLEWMTSCMEEATIKTGVQCKLVPSITRHQLEPHHTTDLLDAIRTVNKRHTIVGVDISGNEEVAIDKQTAKFFSRAKQELGLGITIHAGETGNPESVLWAIDHCTADRLGHGLAIANCPEAIAKIVDKDICVEVCLTSNLRTGGVGEIRDHPVRKFVESGVPFVLCSDNPQVHGASLSDEYGLFLRTFGRKDIIGSMFEKQMRYSFAENS